MKEKILYVLWDERDGYRMESLYLDRESAEIGLAEHYNEHWVYSNKAKICEVKARSYKEDA